MLAGLLQVGLFEVGVLARFTIEPNLQERCIDLVCVLNCLCRHQVIDISQEHGPKTQVVHSSKHLFGFGNIGLSSLKFIPEVGFHLVIAEERQVFDRAGEAPDLNPVLAPKCRVIGSREKLGSAGNDHPIEVFSFIQNG